MTKKQKQELIDILFKIEKVEKFLKRDDVQIIYKGNEINKIVGSDLNYLYSAKEKLTSFLENT